MTACEQCHQREAVIHLTQIVDEQVTTLHLCERCAAEKGVDSPASLTKTPLGSFLAAMGQAPGDAPLPPAVNACPVCGATLDDFREMGRLGCPACYQTFEGPLRDLLRRLHGSTHHMGERYAHQDAGGADGASDPSAAPPTAAPAAQTITELRERLRSAIETENFELAAELRDRLRALE
jgi:protein arginine kinase activator